MVITPINRGGITPGYIKLHYSTLKVRVVGGGRDKSPN